MVKATSATSGQPYGIRRVCQAWGVPRSSFYAAQAPAPESALPAAAPARRWPKPAITDEALLAAIKRDLETSPWTGEGHRVCRNVKRWRDASMALRWIVAAMLDAVKGFRRLKARNQLPQLRAALQAHQQKVDLVASVTQAPQANSVHERRSANDFQHHTGHPPKGDQNEAPRR